MWGRCKGHRALRSLLLLSDPLILYLKYLEEDQMACLTNVGKKLIARVRWKRPGSVVQRVYPELFIEYRKYRCAVKPDSLRNLQLEQTSQMVKGWGTGEPSRSQESLTLWT